MSNTLSSNMQPPRFSSEAGAGNSVANPPAGISNPPAIQHARNPQVAHDGVSETENGTNKASFNDLFKERMPSISAFNKGLKNTPESGNDLPPGTIPVNFSRPGQNTQELLNNSADPPPPTLLNNTSPPGQANAVIDRDASLEPDSLSEAISTGEPDSRIALPLELARRRLDAVSPINNQPTQGHQPGALPAGESAQENHFSQLQTISADLTKVADPIRHKAVSPTELLMGRTESPIQQLDAKELARLLASGQIRENKPLDHQVFSRDPLIGSPISAAGGQPSTQVSLVSTAGNQSTIPEHLAGANWGGSLSKQLVIMVNQNIRSAEIRLNPSHLGPLEVRIDMDDEQVSLAFSSRHALVRDAVEQTLPRLREIFDEKGLSLTHTDISEHSMAEKRQRESEHRVVEGDGYATSPDQAEKHKASRAETVHTRLTSGLVDYYI